VKAFVTGAAGFLGAHLCRKLAQEGHDVIALDVHPSPPSLSGNGIRFLQADLRSPDHWRDALRGVTSVFHLASVHLQVHAPEDEYRAVNVGASVALAAASHAVGVERFVHVSTVGIYGHVAHPPAAEDAPRHPTNAYERTKLEGEEAVAGEAARSGLDVRILRPAWIYGPGCPRTAKLLRSINRGRFVFIGAGNNLRHPVYVGDVVDALLAAASAPLGSRRDHIIAGPRPMTLREVVDTCATTLGKPKPKLQLPRPAGLALGGMSELAFRVIGQNPPFSRRSLAFFENDNAFDCSAAQRDLGYVPRVDLADGLRRTLSDITWPVTL
jgi:nucleoside-diphosphate-sugar epimerase